MKRFKRAAHQIKKVGTLAGIIAFASGILCSCVVKNTNILRSISSASENESCEGLSRSEKKQFAAMALSTRRIENSMKSLAGIAHVIGIDEDVYETKYITLKNFEDKSSRLDFREVAKFSGLLIGACDLVRSGYNPNAKINQKKNPKKFLIVKELCGVSDKEQPPKKRRHANVYRDWAEPLDPSVVSSESRDPLYIQEWVLRQNKIIDSSLRVLTSPEQILQKCTDFNYSYNIEDSIEKLFVCLASFDMQVKEYDSFNQTYSEKPKSSSKELKACFNDFITKKVDIDDQGVPLIYDVPTVRAAAESDKTIKKVFSEEVASNTELKKEVHAPVLNEVTKKAVEKNLLTLSAASHSSQSLPKEDCEQEGISGLEKEMPEYEYELLKNLTISLAQGYLSAASLRSWDSPLLYNQNLKEFVDSISYRRLHDEILLMMMPEFIQLGRQSLDPGSFESVGALPGNGLDLKNIDQRLNQSLREGLKNFTAATEGELRLTPQFELLNLISKNKGVHFVQAARRIKELQKYIQLLLYDFGGNSIEVFKLPEWVNNELLPVPIARHYVGEPLGLGFGKYTNYQCNMFSTSFSFGLDEVPVDSKLLTRADLAIKRLIDDRESKQLAFCEKDHCSPPQEFMDYLLKTNPENIQIHKGGKVRLTSWCQTRFNAARSLVDLQKQIFSLYPALAYFDGSEPFFKTVQSSPRLNSILDNLKQNGFDQNIKDRFLLNEAKKADVFAEKVLPTIQKDLKNHVTLISKKFAQGDLSPLYFSSLQPSLMKSFDYCSSSVDSNRVGVGCSQREKILSCQFNKKAKQWKDSADAPEMVTGILFKTVDLGMDVLFLNSILSGALKLSFTLKGATFGGTTSLFFTGLQMSFNEWLGARYRQLYLSNKAVVAAMGSEGADSYIDYLEELNKSQSIKFNDLVRAFVIGASLSPLDTRQPVQQLNGFQKRLEAKLLGAKEKNKNPDKVKFDPSKLVAVKDWLRQEIKKDPSIHKTLASVQSKFIESNKKVVKASKIEIVTVVEKNRFNEMINAIRRTSSKSSSHFPVLKKMGLDADGFASAIQKMDAETRKVILNEFDEILKSSKSDIERTKNMEAFLKRICVIAHSCGKSGLAATLRCPI